MFYLRVIAISAALSSSAYANNDSVNFGDNWSQSKKNKCAIWLCLPAGFAQGCGGAKSEFRKRIRKGRSPLPSWSSCSAPNKNGNHDPQPYSYQRVYKTYMVYDRNPYTMNVIEGRNCSNGKIYSSGTRNRYVIGKCATTVSYKGVISGSEEHGVKVDSFRFNYEEKEQALVGNLKGLCNRVNIVNPKKYSNSCKF